MKDNINTDVVNTNDNEKDVIMSVCPDCKKECVWDDMVWLNGRCTCPNCYKHRRIMGE